MKPLKIAAMLAGIGLMAGSASAVTKYWAAAGDGAWNTAANWNPNGVPTNADDVVLDHTNATPGAAAYTVTLDNTAGLICGSLTLGEGGNLITLTAPAANTVAPCLTVTNAGASTGNVTINNQGKLIIGTNQAATVFTFTGNCVTHAGGVVQWANTNVGASFATSFPVARTTWYSSGDVGKLELNPNYAATATVDLVGQNLGDFEILAGTVGATTNRLNLTATTGFTVNGNWTIGLLTGAVYTPGTGAVTITLRGNLTNNDNGGINFNQNAVANAGIVFDGTTNINGTATPTSIWAVSNATVGMTVNNGATVTMVPDRSLTFNNNGSPININGTMEFTSGKIGTNQSAGNQVVNVGATGIIKTKKTDGVQTIGTVVGGTGTISYTYNASSQLQYTGTAAQTSGSNSNMPASVGTLVVNNTAGVTLQKSITAATLTDTAGTLNTGAFTLTVGTAGTVAGGLTVASGGTLDLGTVGLTGAGTVTVASGGTLTTKNTNASGAVTGAIGSVTTKTFNAGANLTLNGTGAQFSDTSIATTVNNLILNNSNGLTLNGNLTATNALTLTAGNISTGANILTLGNVPTAAGTLTAGANRIIGNFKRAIPASAASYTFPIATATTPRPATVNFTGAPSTGGSITASFTASDPGSTGLPLAADSGIGVTSQAADGYWTLTAGDGLAGGTYDATFDATGFAPTQANSTWRVIKRANGASPWLVEGTNAANTGAVIKRSGLTSFSDFGIGYDNVQPTVATVATVDHNNVDVTFTDSSSMGTGVTTAANYTISGAGQNDLTANPDTVVQQSGNTYRLTWNTGSTTTGQPVTITVAGVQDAAGNAIGASNSGTDNSALPVAVSAFNID